MYCCIKKLLSFPISALAPAVQSPRGIHRPIRDALNRRGMTSAVFAACATVLLGMAALGTEAGLWYLSLRNARNAADAGAMAGASAHTRYGRDSGMRAAADLTTRNGFTHGQNATTVIINSPPSSGPLSSTAGAYEVIVRRTLTSTLARVISSAVPALEVRAVAGSQVVGTACVLALGGTGSSGLTLTGSNTANATTCIFASNLAGTSSITVQGAATVNINTFQSVGGCSGCSGNRVTLQSPHREYSPPTVNPFAHLDTKVLPNSSQLTCVNNPTSNGSLAPSIPASGAIPNRPNAYCGDVHMTNNNVLNLSPGIYYFYNAGIRMNGGTLQCTSCVSGAGVTVVFTGSTANNIGTLTMNAQSVINLTASPSQRDPDYNGVLFYQDIRATPGNTTRVNGGNTSILNGGLYFPSADVIYNGNMTVSASSCQILVARSIDFTGNSGYAGCSGLQTATPVTTAIRLTE